MGSKEEMKKTALGIQKKVNEEMAINSLKELLKLLDDMKKIIKEALAEITPK